MKSILWNVCIGLVVTLAQAAQTPDGGTPLPPQVEFRPVNASRLRLGMGAAEVVRIMGKAPRSYASPDRQVETLSYATEAIPTRVVLTGRKVTGISLDIGSLGDVRLPSFTRTAWPGMSSRSGSAVPADIFRLILPAKPDPAPGTADAVVIGASAGDLQAVLGKAKLRVDYRIMDQPAAHALYETPDHHTLSVYSLGGVITEITDVGLWSIDETSFG